MKPFASILGLTCALACAPACLAQAPAPVSATITMRDPSSLEVSYRIPPSCAALTFLNDGYRPDIAAALRRDWTAADDCTVFDGTAIRRKNPSCTTLTLRVPATTRVADRVYPWAYPVEHGLYAHTGAYAPAPACGAVDWRFVVPGGTVVVDGKPMAERGARSAVEGGGGEIPTVLIADRLDAGAMARVHASSAFSAQTRATLDATIAAIDGELRKALPGVPFTVPFVVASPSEPHSYWGDVAHRTVMRLSFPPAPGPEQDKLLHSFVTHEMAHLTQPFDWNDAWKEDGATVGEGGAEFLRVVTAFRLGWLDRAGLQDELDKAVNGCLVAADGKPWKAMRNRGWGMNPYQCGLAFYTIGLSMNPGAATPLLRLRDYYARAKRGERTDFAQAIECGAAAGCAPRWLPRLAGPETVDAVLADYARQPGALLRPSADWSPAVADPIAFRHVGLLMAADCKGGVSMYHEPGAARIADGPACGTLREGMAIVGAEGLPLFADSRAVKASIKACQERGRTTLGLKDGASIELACDASVRLPAQLYRVDVERALALTR